MIFVQEIEECVAKKQNEPDTEELSMRQKRNRSTVSQILTQIQDLQNKVNSFYDAREFYDPDTASSSGASLVPSQPSSFRAPEKCEAAILDCRDTRNTWGTSGSVLQSELVRR